MDNNENKNAELKKVAIISIIVLVLSLSVIVMLKSPSHINEFKTSASELLDSRPDIVSNYTLGTGAGTITLYRKTWDNETDASRLELMHNISSALTKIYIDSGNKMDYYYAVTFKDEYGNNLGKADWKGNTELSEQ